jgi:hypothetical protein
VVAEKFMDRKDLARLLQRLAQTLERSSVADVEALLAGRAALVISADMGASRLGERREAGPKKRRRSGKDLAGLGVQLRRLESREDGSRLLTRLQLNKNELEELARLMDLPVLREDDAERLREKIVEASIGSRLNSQAVRGR